VCVRVCMCVCPAWPSLRRDVSKETCRIQRDVSEKETYKRDSAGESLRCMCKRERVCVHVCVHIHVRVCACIRLGYLEG